MEQETWNTTINILGINISTLNKQQVLKKIDQFLTDGPPKFSSRSPRSEAGDEAGGEVSGQHQIVTPNPEFLLQAGHDEEFFYILNKADLAIPDGVGLKFAGWMMGRNIYRYTGVDLVKDILQSSKFKVKSMPRAQSRGYKVAIINWKDGLSKKEDIEKVLRGKYENIEFFVVDVDRKIFAGTQNFVFLQKFQPDILFVALGAPYQEKWIYHNLPKLPSVKLAIGVGGAFDFLTGKIKRAPKLMRILGLEWLWRICNQPAGKRLWRIKRIYKAIIIFPWKFFKWRFVNPFLYRPNVACLLYRKVIKLAAIPQYCGSDYANKIKEVKYKILLVERRNEAGYWQLPQGGTDGEDLMTAGARELSEEINCNKFKPVMIFKNVWKYKSGNEISRAGIFAKFLEGYKGQKQGLFIAEFLGEDSDIKVNFWDHSNWKWIDSDDLINEVHPIRKEAAKIFIEKFNSIDKEKY